MVLNKRHMTSIIWKNYGFSIPIKDVNLPTKILVESGVIKQR
jgi:hypothetical protein